jgi:hypothetical protein
MGRFFLREKKLKGTEGEDILPEFSVKSAFSFAN